MKIISTQVKTGDILNMDNLTGVVGTYKDGKIKVLWSVNKFSGFSCFYSTREINKMIGSGKIKIKN